MADSAESFTKVKLNNIPFSPLIQQASNLTTERYHVGQARFPLHKLMLIILNEPLVLRTFGNGFQDHLLHHFRTRNCKRENIHTHLKITWKMGLCCVYKDREIQKWYF